LWQEFKSGEKVLELRGKKVKPIRWVGTQRGAFTHRKDNQRNKIKNLLGKLKRAKQEHDQRRV
jgi:hypothetical protein